MSYCCLDTHCKQCCIQTNMLLSHDDIETIQKFGYDASFFVEHHHGWLQLKNTHGRCVFHNGARCTIYAYRPEGCMLYPVVYDHDHKRAILDSACPQKKCFQLSQQKTQQLYALVSRLEKEREQRKNLRKKVRFGDITQSRK